MFLFIVTLLCFLNLISNGINADANLRIAFAPFSNLTNQFLSTVQPNNGLNITKKYIYQILSSEALPPDYQTYINDVWQTYVGYIILDILGIIFIIFFTLVGCCYCCCRCCCKKCGAIPPGASEKNPKTRRIVYNVLLFLFVTMIMIGGIVSMASNVILLDAIKPAYDTTDKSGNILANIDTTISYAVSYINYIKTNGLNNGMNVLRNTLQSISSVLSGVITVFANTFFAQLNFETLKSSTSVIISAYKQMGVLAQNLSSIASLHQNQSAPFAQFLQSIVKNLTNLLNSTACQNYTDNCNQVNMSMAGLVMGFNYSNINYTVDINAQSVVGAYNISDLENSQKIVLDNSQNITNALNSTISGYITNFSNSLSANSSIYQTFTNAFNVTDFVINYINSYKSMIYNFNIGSSTIQNGAIYDYYKWVFYGFIIIIGITLIVVLLFYVGLCFGVCGGPNFEDATCCSKQAGTGFFMGAVAISFLFGWLIMIIVTIMFQTGGLVQTEACRYFKRNPDINLVQTMDQIVNASITKINFSVPLNNATIVLPNVNYLQSLMMSCPNSTDLISAFNIPTSYMSSVSNIIYQQLIAPSMNTLVQNIQSYSIKQLDVGPLVNSTNQINSIIVQLSNINSTKTLVELAKPVTLITDIPAFLETISTLAQVSAQGFPEFSKSLNSIINQLNSTILPFNSTHTAYYLQKKLFINSSQSIGAPLQTLINTISVLPSKMSDAKTSAFTAANATLIQNTTSLINQTIFNVIINLGDCRLLSTTFYSAVDTLCSTFLIPFNNIWMGLGWFLLFIIPAIIVSLKLHRIYQYTHIETNTSAHNNAYQLSNNFLSENDMALIRLKRPEHV